MNATSIFNIGDKVNGTFSKLAWSGEVIGFSFNGHCVRIAIDKPVTNLPAATSWKPSEKGIKVLTFNPSDTNVTFSK